MEQLLELTSAGFCSAADTEDLLLAALAVASAVTAPPLTTGLLRLFQATPPSSREAAAPWRSHLLCKALLANAAAAQPLLLGVLKWVSRAADEAGSLVLPRLHPFLTFVALEPRLALQQPHLSLQLLSGLARLACCCRSQDARAQLLRALVALLPALPLPSEAVAIIMDVVESFDGGPGGWGMVGGGFGAPCLTCHWRDVPQNVPHRQSLPSRRADPPMLAALASHVVSISHEAVLASADALLQQLLATLSRLATMAPDLVDPYAGHLGMHLLQQPGAPPALGSPAARSTIALVGQMLSDARPVQRGGLACDQLAAFLSLPLLQQVALPSASSDVRRWAASTWWLLTEPGGPSTAAAGGSQPGPRLHGPAAEHDAAQLLLQRLWGRPAEARCWLSSLQLALADSNQRAAKDPLHVHAGALLVCCAFLSHSNDSLQSAALGALRAAVPAAPLLGLSLLPLILQQLRRHVDQFMPGVRARLVTLHALHGRSRTPQRMLQASGSDRPPSS